MTWYDIVIQYVIPFVSILASVIITKFKNAKVRKYANHILSVSEVAKDYIIEAENHTNYTGVEKKSFVLSRLLKYLVDNHIRSVSEKTLSDIIENEVALTNSVNVQKKSVLQKPSQIIVNEPSTQPQALNV